jgi:hypothetical protein
LVVVAARKGRNVDLLPADGVEFVGVDAENLTIVAATC